MKILNAQHIKLIDILTIKNEPVTSIDLMERAAVACMKRIITLVAIDEAITVVCGKGNNGGDGLAIARLLLESGFHCNAYVIHYTEKFSDDSQINYDRLKEKFPANLHDINTIEELKDKAFDGQQVLIDALLG